LASFVQRSPNLPAWQTITFSPGLNRFETAASMAPDPDEQNTATSLYRSCWVFGIAAKPERPVQQRGDDAHHGQELQQQLESKLIAAEVSLIEGRARGVFSE
jgi:hypothetical protein